jgi:spectinomycin phosphotransferase
VRRLGARHAVAVYPFVAGRSLRFGEPLPPAEAAALVDMLARLHRSTPAVASIARLWTTAVPGRGALEHALRDLAGEWTGGPYSEPARALVAGRAEAIRRLLATFDGLVNQVAAAGGEPVVTHGEPHPGNLLGAGGRLLLVDWDTVALAPPERDLWILAAQEGEELARYEEATGRRVDEAAVRLFRLRWLLDDVSIVVDAFRSAHRRTADTERAWLSLARYMQSEDLAPRRR